MPAMIQGRSDKKRMLYKYHCNNLCSTFLSTSVTSEIAVSADSAVLELF
jgi:hypothetical protein